MTEQEYMAQIAELKGEIQYLQRRNIELSVEKNRLESVIANLERELTTTRAGRKKHNTAWTANRDRIASLMRSGYGASDICKKMSISRNTFYRYRKEIVKSKM